MVLVWCEDHELMMMGTGDLTKWKKAEEKSNWFFKSENTGHYQMTKAQVLTQREVNNETKKRLPNFYSEFNCL